MILRDYQKRCLVALKTETNKRSVINMCCGSGKTVVFSHFLNEAQFPLAVIVVPSINLMEQYRARYILQPENHFAVYSEGDTELDAFLLRDTNKIITCTYQSIHRLIDRINTKIDYMIFDEAHHVCGLQTAELVFGFLDESETRCSFWTATTIESMFPRCGKVVFKYSYAEAVAEGHCRRINIHVMVYKDDVTKQQSTTCDVLLKSILEAEKDYPYANVLTYHSRVTEVQDMSFIDSTQSFSRLEEGLQEAFQRVREDTKFTELSFRAIDAHTRNRQEILDAFNTKVPGRIFILASCGTLNEGVDTKWATQSVEYAPSSSVNRCTQKLGRISRKPEEIMPPASLMVPVPVVMPDEKMDEKKVHELLYNTFQQEANYETLFQVFASLQGDENIDVNTAIQNLFSSSSSSSEASPSSSSSFKVTLHDNLGLQLNLSGIDWSKTVQRAVLDVSTKRGILPEDEKYDLFEQWCRNNPGETPKRDVTMKDGYGGPFNVGTWFKSKKNKIVSVESDWYVRLSEVNNTVKTHLDEYFAKKSVKLTADEKYDLFEQWCRNHPGQTPIQIATMKDGYGGPFNVGRWFSHQKKNNIVSVESDWYVRLAKVNNTVKTNLDEYLTNIGKHKLTADEKYDLFEQWCRNHPGQTPKYDVTMKDGYGGPYNVGQWFNNQKMMKKKEKKDVDSVWYVRLSEVNNTVKTHLDEYFAKKSGKHKLTADEKYDLFEQWCRNHPGQTPKLDVTMKDGYGGPFNVGQWFSTKKKNNIVSVDSDWYVRLSEVNNTVKTHLDEYLAKKGKHKLTADEKYDLFEQWCRNHPGETPKRDVTMKDGYGGPFNVGSWFGSQKTNKIVSVESIWYVRLSEVNNTVKTHLDEYLAKKKKKGKHKLTTDEKYDLFEQWCRNHPGQTPTKEGTIMQDGYGGPFNVGSWFSNKKLKKIVSVDSVWYVRLSKVNNTVKTHLDGNLAKKSAKIGKHKLTTDEKYNLFEKWCRNHPGQTPKSNVTMKDGYGGAFNVGSWFRGKKLTKIVSVDSVWYVRLSKVNNTVKTHLDEYLPKKRKKKKKKLNKQKKLNKKKRKKKKRKTDDVVAPAVAKRRKLEARFQSLQEKKVAEAQRLAATDTSKLTTKELKGLLGTGDTYTEDCHSPEHKTWKDDMNQVLHSSTATACPLFSASTVAYIKDPKINHSFFSMFYSYNCMYIFLSTAIAYHTHLN